MAYVRLDKVKPAAHIESFVHDADLKNGQFVTIGATLPEHGGEAVGIELAAEGSEPEAIVTTVQGVYQNTADFDITKEVTKAGKAGRAHIVESGDVISFLVSPEELDGFTEGDDTAIGADGLGVKVAGEGDQVIGKVLAKEFQNNVGDLLVVRFK